MFFEKYQSKQYFAFKQQRVKKKVNFKLYKLFVQSSLVFKIDIKLIDFDSIIIYSLSKN